MISFLPRSQRDMLSFLAILEILPKDIIDILFTILPITSKRNFIRCNRELNLKTDLMPIYENKFMTKIQKFYKEYLPTNMTKIQKFSKKYLPTNLTKLEKYTLEFIYDNCEKLIPIRYICGQNKLCNSPPFMYFHCAKSDNIPLLKILLNHNPTYGKFITYGAASNGHLDVLKWIRENSEEKFKSFSNLASTEQGCEWDSCTCRYAALNGHLHVLKWVRENGC